MIRDERQTFRGTTRISVQARTLISDNGGTTVLLSQAASGRTKQVFHPRRLSAGDRLSLWSVAALFPFDAFTLFLFIAQPKGKGKGSGGIFADFREKNLAPPLGGSSHLRSK